MVDLRQARFGTNLVFFICGIGHGTWAPRLADIKGQIGASDGQLGMALLMLGIGALIAMPITGGLVGRVGSRRMSLVTAIAHGLAFPLMVLAWDWISLGVAMLIYGLAIASLDVAMNVQATEIEERYGHPIMSSFHGIYSVGDMMGALATGFAATIALSLGAHFLIVAIIVLLAGVVGCRLMITLSTKDRGNGEDSHRFVMPSGTLVIVGLIALAALLAEGSVGDWSAVYLTEYQDADTPMAAIALTVFALTMAIMRFLGDRLVACFGPFVMLQASGLLAALGLAIALLTETAMIAIAGYGVAGLGIAVLFPVALSVAPKLSKMSKGASVAAVATLGYGGFLVGPPVIGLLADWISLPLALGLVVILTAAIMPLALIASRYTNPGAVSKAHTA